MVFQTTNYEIGEFEIMTDIIEDVVFDCDYNALSEKYIKIELRNIIKVIFRIIFEATLTFALISCVRFQKQILSMSLKNQIIILIVMCLLFYIIYSITLSIGIDISYCTERYNNILDFYNHYIDGTLLKVQRNYTSPEHMGYIKYYYVDTHNEIQENRFLIDDAVTLDNISSNRLYISLDTVIYQRKVGILISDMEIPEQ